VVDDRRRDVGEHLTELLLVSLFVLLLLSRCVEV
jgi:hypothetical protein